MPPLIELNLSAKKPEPPPYVYEHDFKLKTGKQYLLRGGYEMVVLDGEGHKDWKKGKLLHNDATYWYFPTGQFQQMNAKKAHPYDVIGEAAQVEPEGIKVVVGGVYKLRNGNETMPLSKVDNGYFSATLVGVGVKSFYYWNNKGHYCGNSVIGITYPMGAPESSRCIGSVVSVPGPKASLTYEEALKMWLAGKVVLYKYKPGFQFDPHLAEQWQVFPQHGGVYTKTLFETYKGKLDYKEGV